MFRTGHALAVFLVISLPYFALAALALLVSFPYWVALIDAPWVSAVAVVVGPLGVVAGFLMSTAARVRAVAFLRWAGQTRNLLKCAAVATLLFGSSLGAIALLCWRTGPIGFLLVARQHMPEWARDFDTEFREFRGGLLEDSSLRTSGKTYLRAYRAGMQQQPDAALQNEASRLERPAQRFASRILGHISHAWLEIAQQRWQSAAAEIKAADEFVPLLWSRDFRIFATHEFANLYVHLSQFGQADPASEGWLAQSGLYWERMERLCSEGSLEWLVARNGRAAVATLRHNYGDASGLYRSITEFSADTGGWSGDDTTALKQLKGDAWNNLAVVQLNLGEPGLATRTCTSALAFPGDERITRLNLMLAFSRLGKLVDARAVRGQLGEPHNPAEQALFGSVEDNPQQRGVLYAKAIRQNDETPILEVTEPVGNELVKVCTSKFLGLVFSRDDFVRASGTGGSTPRQGQVESK